MKKFIQLGALLLMWILIIPASLGLALEQIGGWLYDISLSAAEWLEENT